MLLIFILKIIHFILLLFVLSAPFYNADYLFKSIVILGYVLYKWKVDGSCLLTKIEYFLLNNEKEEQGFIYRLINPLFNLNEEIFKNNLEYFTFYWFMFLLIIYIIRFV